jgi:2,4-dienoyl-CoA reductase-like NADH-dependent reductase (Old Yellow Enzyme family)
MKLIPKLFQPLQIRDILLKNRVALSPMCQYSAGNDGAITDWHHHHWVTRAIGGAGLIMSEAMAVAPNGRLTESDLMLCHDGHVEKLQHSIRTVKRFGASFGIQLSHCGRKAWSKTKGKNGAYKLVSSCEMPFDSGWEKPSSLSPLEIGYLIDCFINSGKLAISAGADLIEIHAGHGYLFHQFLSPLSNNRVDEYGGSIANRARFLVDLTSRMRREIGEGVPIFVRLSCTDWADDGVGFNLEEAAIVSKMLKNCGIDLVDCSAGGTLPVTNPQLYEGYQIKFSEYIKSQAGVLTSGVGLLKSPAYCEEALKDNRCDLIMLGRELLRNPYWPIQAANYFQEKEIIPTQYLRGFS